MPTTVLFFFVLSAGALVFIPANEFVLTSMCVAEGYGLWGWLLGGSVLAALCLGVLSQRRSQSEIRNKSFGWRCLSVVSAAVVASCCGTLINGFQLTQIISSQMPSELEGIDIPLVVQVADLPVQQGQSTRFIAKVIEYGGSASTDSIATYQWQDKKIRISWYKSPQIRAGELWRLTLRLKRPRGFVNPKGFDYQAWLLSQGVSATAYVRSTPQPRYLSSQFSFHAWRQDIVENLFTPEQSESLRFEALLRALIVGDRSRVTQAQWDVLQMSGTTHLLAISGLHIGLVALWAYILINALCRCAGAWGHKRYVYVLPGISSVLCALLYAALAGFSIPTQRALILTMSVCLARLLGRQVNIIHTLLLAAAIVIFLDPFALMQSGFWLSFSAVALLVYVFAGRLPVKKVGHSSETKSRRWLAIGRQKVGAKVSGIVIAQFALFVGLLVPLSAQMMPISLNAPIANIFAIPLVSFITVPSVFMAVLTLGTDASALFLGLADQSLALLWFLLEWIEKLSSNMWWATNRNGLWGLFAASIGVLLLLAPKGLGGRIMGLVLLLGFILPKTIPKNTVFAAHLDAFVHTISKTVEYPEETSANLTVLDVGQGLAVVFSESQFNLVYDTGAKFGPNFDIGSRVLAPFLRSQGVREIDLLYVSHSDNDHAGGLEGLMSKIPAKQIFAGEHEPLADYATQPCELGQKMQIRSVNMQVLWPPNTDEVDNSSTNAFLEMMRSSNNRSCVVLLEYEGVKVLFLGDVYVDVERYLLDNGLLPEGIDIVVAPHHGSKTSSSQALIQQLSAKHVVFSAGYKNRYHHPHSAVLKRYERSGAQIYNTSESGAITFTWSKRNGLTVRKEREASPRLWF